MACRPRPDTDVTRPPSASTSAITAASELPTISRTASGSGLALPPSALTSANSTVTGRSSSRGAGSDTGGRAVLARAVAARRPPTREVDPRGRCLPHRSRSPPRTARPGTARWAGPGRPGRWRSARSCEPPSHGGPAAGIRATARLRPPRRPGRARRPPARRPASRPRAASRSGPVAGQREPRLLAQRFQVLARQRRPVGVRLVGQQVAFVGERRDQGAFALGAGSHRERPRNRGLLPIRVHLRVGRRPDVGQVGLQHRGRRARRVPRAPPGPSTAPWTVPARPHAVPCRGTASRRPGPG